MKFLDSTLEDISLRVETLPVDMAKDEKNLILQERKAVLDKVKDDFSNHLNLSKVLFYFLQWKRSNVQILGIE